MLWYAQYTWFPGTTREAVAKRLVEEHDVGNINGTMIQGWYGLAGGGAGFLLLNADDPRDVTQMLQPFMDLMSWDVRAIYEFPYAETITRLREIARQGG